MMSGASFIPSSMADEMPVSVRTSPRAYVGLPTISGHRARVWDDKHGQRAPSASCSDSCPGGAQYERRVIGFLDAALLGR